LMGATLLKVRGAALLKFRSRTNLAPVA